MVMGTGDRVLVERTTNALRNLGANVPSQPAPGLLGTRTVPTARQLGQAPKPQFGPGSGTPTPPAGSRSCKYPHSSAFPRSSYTRWRISPDYSGFGTFSCNSHTVH
jgi:hypothetical protein